MNFAPVFVDGQGGGTLIQPAMPECAVIPAVRVCRYCDAPCTADDKTCPNCGAPDDGKCEEHVTWE
jgi:hypothetical protein